MDWHPLLASHEPSPGIWELLDYADRPYGRIELRRVSDGLRYRCEYSGELIGWSTSLRTACERVHQAHLRSHGPNGGPLSEGRHG